MKKILISDWFEKFGGAEKVVQAICEIYKFDQYYAYIDLMPSDIKKKVFGNDIFVHQSKFLKLFGKRFRMLMPFFPIIVREFNSSNKKKQSDLIISSSWALSKGFKLNGAKHICYLQARNFKYVWDEADLYYTGILKLFGFTKYYLRKFDIRSAQNPDVLISNSEFVRKWTKEHYNRDSIVIYPPVDVEDFYVSNKKEDYYITIGRLEPYKRFDIVIKAFTQNKKKLIVIGDGTQSKYLKSIASSNVQFMGYLDKSEIKNLLSKAKAFVYVGIEDFGIVIVESLASGVPVIGFNGGAIEEIVIHKVDGLLFEKQTASSLNEAIEEYESNIHWFNSYKIHERAQRFSKKRFQKEFKEFVDSKMI